MNEETVLEAPSTNYWLVPLLLLSLWEGERYGHELTRGIEDFGFEETHPETVYLGLRQMEEEGTVISWHDGPDNGTPWRRYWITGPGESYLESWADSLSRYQGVIDVFLMAYGTPAPDVYRGKEMDARFFESHASIASVAVSRLDIHEEETG